MIIINYKQLTKLEIITFFYWARFKGELGQNIKNIIYPKFLKGRAHNMMREVDTSVTTN